MDWQVESGRAVGRDFWRQTHHQESRGVSSLSQFQLIGLFLSQGLYKAPVIKQMERILALWPNIVTVCQTIQGGAMFELPLKRTLLRQILLRQMKF
jgi:hypothetical protein